MQHGLCMDRDHLYARADQRLDTMIQEGFLEEVRALLDMGYDRTLPSMSGLGYRELAAHLDGALPLADAIESAKNMTHDFIRRQNTWFHGHDTGIQWHDVETLDTAEVIDNSRHWLEA